MSNKKLAANLLGIRHNASQIAEHTAVNFWLAENEVESPLHVEWIHEHFAKMAEILGYEIKRIEPAESTDA